MQENVIRAEESLEVGNSLKGFNRNNSRIAASNSRVREILSVLDERDIFRRVVLQCFRDGILRTRGGGTALGFQVAPDNHSQDDADEKK